MGVIEDNELVFKYEGCIKAAVASMSRRLGSREMGPDDMRAIALESVVYRARWGDVDPALMTTIVKRRILDEYRRLRGRRKDRRLTYMVNEMEAHTLDTHSGLVWEDAYTALSSRCDWRAVELLRLSLSGYSMSEAAAEIGVSASTASLIFRRASPGMGLALRELGIKN